MTDDELQNIADIYGLYTQEDVQNKEDLIAKLKLENSELRGQLEKLKWHDLNENPECLPDNGESVLVKMFYSNGDSLTAVRSFDAKYNCWNYTPFDTYRLVKMWKRIE